MNYFSSFLYLACETGGVNKFSTDCIWDWFDFFLKRVLKNLTNEKLDEDEEEDEEEATVLVVIMGFLVDVAAIVAWESVWGSLFFGPDLNKRLVNVFALNDMVLCTPPLDVFLMSSLINASELFLLRFLLAASSLSNFFCWASMNMRICFKMPASKSSTLSFIATEVSTNLQPYLNAIDLPSFNLKYYFSI